MIRNKSTLLLLLLSILGTALSDGPAGFGCYNSIVATKRGDSWTYGDNGYQNFSIVITNQSPNGCNAVVCAPLFYFVECSLFNQWNWAPQCINCNADGTPQSRQATIGGPASLDSALAPGQTLDSAGFTVQFKLSNADSFYVASGSTQTCGCAINSQTPNCRTPTMN